jgi:hypothetical protein
MVTVAAREFLTEKIKNCVIDSHRNVCEFYQVNKVNIQTLSVEQDSLILGVH